MEQQRRLNLRELNQKSRCLKPHGKLRCLMRRTSSVSRDRGRFQNRSTEQAQRFAEAEGRWRNVLHAESKPWNRGRRRMRLSAEIASLESQVAARQRHCAEQMERLEAETTET